MTKSSNVTTQRRDLRTGSSLWEESPSRGVPTRRLVGDVSTEVAVVGGGISGALMAHALAQRGIQAVVLDRREPVHGSTLASTALLQFEIDVSLHELSVRIGRDKARRAWRRSVRAVRALSRLVEDSGIRCGYARRHSLYLAGDVYGARALASEVESRSRAGVPGRFVDRDTLSRTFGITRTGAIMSPGSAVCNPAQLTAGCLRRAVALGVRVFSPADVVDVAGSAQGVQLYTSHGVTVHARDVIFCTGYELPKVLSLSGHKVKSTWAIATRPTQALPDWLSRTVVWEASDPYLYMRTTADGRIIAGGEDEQSDTLHARRSLLASKSRRILHNVEEMLGVDNIQLSHRWAGAFGESSTGLPIIDALPGLPHCYVVAGFGGNGITYSMIASELICRRLEGRKDSDSDLYRAPR